jgi:hypothetical protein
MILLFRYGFGAKIRQWWYHRTASHGDLLSPQPSVEKSKAFLDFRSLGLWNQGSSKKTGDTFGLQFDETWTRLLQKGWGSLHKTYESSKNSRREDGWDL